MKIILLIIIKIFCMNLPNENLFKNLNNKEIDSIISEGSINGYYNFNDIHILLNNFNQKFDSLKLKIFDLKQKTVDNNFQNAYVLYKDDYDNKKNIYFISYINGKDLDTIYLNLKTFLFLIKNYLNKENYYDKFFDLFKFVFIFQYNIDTIKYINYNLINANRLLLITKNRFDNKCSDKNKLGVNLFHNFNINFNNKIYTICDDLYNGNKPNSEIETNNILEFMKNNNPYLIILLFKENINNFILEIPVNINKNDKLYNIINSSDLLSNKDNLSFLIKNKNINGDMDNYFFTKLNYLTLNFKYPVYENYNNISKIKNEFEKGFINIEKIINRLIYSFDLKEKDLQIFSCKNDILKNICEFHKVIYYYNLKIDLNFLNKLNSNEIDLVIDTPKNVLILLININNLNISFKKSVNNSRNIYNFKAKTKLPNNQIIIILSNNSELNDNDIINIYDFKVKHKKITISNQILNTLKNKKFPKIITNDNNFKEFIKKRILIWILVLIYIIISVILIIFLIINSCKKNKKINKIVDIKNLKFKNNN